MVVGILTIRQANEITEKVQRLRIIVIGIMFLLSGLVVEYNFLLNKVENYTINIIVAFLLNLILIVSLIVIAKTKSSNNKNEEL
jgi:di/tricarboxylate transporter